MKFNLNQYKENGKFQALVNTTDPYWQTVKGQKYLKAFYELEEAWKFGLINTDELNFLQCKLTHPNTQCPWSTTYHVVKRHLTEDELQERAEEWARHNV